MTWKRSSIVGACVVIGSLLTPPGAVNAGNRSASAPSLHDPVSVERAPEDVLSEFDQRLMSVVHKCAAEISHVVLETVGEIEKLKNAKAPQSEVDRAARRGKTRSTIAAFRCVKQISAVAVRALAALRATDAPPEHAEYVLQARFESAEAMWDTAVWAIQQIDEAVAGGGNAKGNAKRAP